MAAAGRSNEAKSCSKRELLMEQRICNIPSAPAGDQVMPLPPVDDQPTPAETTRR